MSLSGFDDNKKTGYIKLYRSIMRDEFYFYECGRKANKMEAKIDLLLLAYGVDTTRDIDGKPVRIPRGSYWTATRFLSKRWEWSKRTVTKFLDYLQCDQFLQKSCTKNGTLITIVNYDEYNPLQNQGGGKVDAKETQSRRRVDKNNKVIKKERKEFCGRTKYPVLKTED